MAPRAYRLGVRAASVGETRDRVVAAARSLFTEGGFHRTPLDEVARRADVARATVYHQFGSKVGVLEAVLADFEARAGLGRLVEVVERAPVEGLVRAIVTAGCRYWGTDPDLCRAIIGLGAADPQAGDLLRQHDSGRLRLLTRAVARLEAAGALAGGPGGRRAVDVLWVVTSFDAYDLLARGRGMSTGEVEEALAALAAAGLGAGTR